MNEEVNDLKRYISLIENKQFATFKIENVSNTINYCEQLQQENQELKKQLEEIDYTVIPNSDIKPVIDKYKAQQKEFIKFLEDNWKQTQDIWYIKILQKYKEIIGD